MRNKVQMLEEMFDQQRRLNEVVERRNNVNLVSVNIHGDLDLAIIDEIGELNHELKGIWCWWKKSQPPVDYGKVLGELVDIWHFVMTRYLVNRNITVALKEFTEEMAYPSSGFPLYSEVIKEFAKSQTMSLLCQVTRTLGFTFDEIYEIYMRKNMANLERQEGDY